MTGIQDFVHTVCRRLSELRVPYMIGGSIASSFYGRIRSTQDVDIVIGASGDQLGELLHTFSDCYVSDRAAREALHRRSMFNVIDYQSGYKADLIFPKRRAFDEQAFERRVGVEYFGQLVHMTTREDIILFKLEWAELGESERQLEDAVGVALAQWQELDREYLRYWAIELNVKETLDALFQRVVEAQAPSTNP